MSARLMGQVWELDLPANQQTVLLALADHATDNGGSVYPSIEYLAWKVGCSERTVQRLLRSLEEAGIIEAVHGHGVGRGHKTEYQIHLQNGDKKTPFHCPKTRQSDTIIKGDNLSLSREKVTNTTIKGDKSGQTYKAEPSVEPSVLSSSAVASENGAAKSQEKIQTKTQRNSDAFSEEKVERSDTSKSPKSSAAKLTDSTPADHPVVLKLCEYSGIRLEAHSTTMPQRVQTFKAAKALIADGVSPPDIDECAKRLRRTFPFNDNRPIPPQEMQKNYYPMMSRKEPPTNGTNPQYRPTANERREANLRGHLDAIERLKAGR